MDCSGVLAIFYNFNFNAKWFPIWWPSCDSHLLPGHYPPCPCFFSSLTSPSSSPALPLPYLLLSVPLFSSPAPCTIRHKWCGIYEVTYFSSLFFFICFSFSGWGVPRTLFPSSALLSEFTIPLQLSSGMGTPQLSASMCALWCLKKYLRVRNSDPQK